MTKLSLWVSALLICLLAAGCNGANNASTATSSVSPTATASADPTGNSASPSPSASDSASNPASPSPSAGPDSTSSPVTAPADSSKAGPNMEISFAEGTKFKPFMIIPEGKQADELLKLLKNVDWKKKDSISMDTSPNLKLNVQGSGKDYNGDYFVWKSSEDQYEIVMSGSTKYAKLSKADTKVFSQWMQ